MAPVASAPPSTPPKAWWAVVAQIVATAGPAIAALLIIGGYMNEMKEHERRIALLEQRTQAQDATLSQIQITTARTDATLQALRGKTGALQP